MSTAVLSRSILLVLGGWSFWSEWSPCSRTCDRGVAVQSRRCLHYAGCRGDSVRYKICNESPCPSGSRDFREVQCSEYDGLPHEGAIYKWEPAGGGEPCSLTCRAKDVRGGPVVTLSPRTHDGTRCGLGNQEMCINGKCQKVGCDLELGSEKTLDACGVCGGDGSSCNRPSYRWDTKSAGPCSATCGGGYQMLSAVCVAQGTGGRVSDDKCDSSLKSDPVIQTCGTVRCPTSWRTGQWGDCSEACGRGYQLREVYCAEPRNTSFVRAADHYCTTPRPTHRQSCNIHECSRWYEGIWSECSVTCGEGVQTRVVQCRDSDGRSSGSCDPLLKPDDWRSCRAEPCPPQTVSSSFKHQLYTPPWWDEEQEDEEQLGSMGHLGSVAPLLPRPEALTDGQPVPSEPTFMTSNWSKCSVSCGEGLRKRDVKCKIFLDYSRTVAEIDDSHCSGLKPPSIDTCTMPPCPESMTMNTFDTIRSDDADARPIGSLEISEEQSFNGKSIKDPFDQWRQPQAQAHVRVYPTLHSDEAARKDPIKEGSDKIANSIEFDLQRGTRRGFHRGDAYVLGGYDPQKQKHRQYRWKTAGFTPCSASCLGGIQESVVKCILNSEDYKIVPSEFCQTSERPDIITRTCNDQPCPPRWNISDFEPCSKPCGGGIMRREVNCIHELTRGGANTLIVPNSLCPQPPPHAQQYCNVIECPAEWVTERWSKCSAPCGTGYKTRIIRCQSVRPFGDLVDQPFEKCHQKMPRTRRKCNKRACQGKTVKESPVIKAQQSQNYIQEKFMKKLSLKVGGQATVFRGVTLKIRCPVRRFDKSQLEWWHDGRKVDTFGSSPNTLVTEKGILKVIKAQYTDAGQYTCKARGSEATLTLYVKPLPSSFSSREDGNQNHVTEDVVSIKELSRKEESEHTKKKKKKKKKGENVNMSSAVKSLEVLPSPLYPTLSEGPFKVSSHNMHTEEEISGENNDFEFFDNLVQEGVERTYTYGTVSHKGAPRGPPSRGISLLGVKMKNSDAEPNWNEEETTKMRSQVFGILTHHSDGSRLTSDERHIFATINGKPFARPKLPDTALTISEENTEKQQLEEDLMAPVEDVNDITTFDNVPVDVTENSIDSEIYQGPSIIDNDIKRKSQNHNSLSRDEYGDLYPWEIPPVPSFHPWGPQNAKESWSGKAEGPWPADVPPNSSSGGSRTVPYVIRLLSEMESTFSKFRSGRLGRESESTENPFGIPEILGKGSPEDVEFEWSVTNWTECSQTCRYLRLSAGHQVRSIQCRVKLNNKSLPVDTKLCEDAGLSTPPTIQECGLQECPQWHVGEWSPCENSRCFTLHYAFQRRDVTCHLHNYTEVASLQCDEIIKPRHRRECYNKHCTGVWRTGDWSECTAPCDGKGYRTRVLQCVWNGTKKVAGNACRELPRPEVIKWCDGLPCNNTSQAVGGPKKRCRDRSKYCNIVKRINMCKVQHYRSQCCRSCP